MIQINATPIRPNDPTTLHCGYCGLPYTSAIGAPECDCPPIKLRKDVPAPVVQEPPPDDPPSGWRDRPSLL
jgi:hypothetical protein